jgi:hypothetical protein
MAIQLADLGRFDEAFKTARENYQGAEKLGLLYSRTEGRRCLAHVHFKHGELDETLRLCDEIFEMLGEEKSRISRLWLGPLHIEALFQSGRSEEASRRLAAYETLVSACQTPRFEREIVRLKKMISDRG